jgi:hypothetical protein
MTTLTQAPKSRKPQPRSAHVGTIGNSLVLWLTVGKNTTAYRVLSIASQMGGIAFRLEKADKGDGEPEVYDVLLDGCRSRCCCRGFEQHGMCRDGKGCKHIAGLQAAIAAKQLSAPAVKPQPVDEVLELDDL